MSQQKAWNKEYQNALGVPTSTRTTPSYAVRRLLDFITEHKLNIGKEVIDLGCGIGRNALYLAGQGYNVTAVDFAESALAKFRQTLEASPQANSILIKEVNLAEKFPFADSSFDLAIDVVTSTTLTSSELPGFEAELRRVVHPGGLLMTYVLSQDDGFLEATAPGKTATTVDNSGITDNYFSEDQLRNLYTEWEVLELDKIEKVDHFYGKDYTRRIWWWLLKNK